MPATAKSIQTKRWTLEYPELGTGPLPIEPYISKEYFEWEREKLFKRTWLCLGRRAEEIPQPGDYLVHEIKGCQVSLLVVRGKDGVIRSFHNVCKHRGNRLAWEAQGACRAGLSCKFHGWTYDPQGRLVGVPEEDMFFDFRRDDYNLTPIATDTWEGFLFVNLDPTPQETLREYLGEVVELLQGYPFAQLPVCWSYTAEQHCNWRILRDSPWKKFKCFITRWCRGWRRCSSISASFPLRSCLRARIPCLRRHGGSFTWRSPWPK